LHVRGDGMHRPEGNGPMEDIARNDLFGIAGPVEIDDLERRATAHDDSTGTELERQLRVGMKRSVS
jgi:hypothetical protein